MEWPLVVPGDVGRLFVVRAATLGVAWPRRAWRGLRPAAALLYVGTSAGRAIGGSKGARRRGRV